MIRKITVFSLFFVLFSASACKKSPSDLSEAEKKSINAEMFKAAKSGNHDKVKELIDNGADPESTDPEWDESNPDYSAPSAVQAAIAANHFETVKVLFEKGAKFPQSTECLHYLVMSEKPDINIIKLAESKGADLKYVDLGGDTIMNLAAARGHVEIVKYLSSKGVPYTLEGKKLSGNQAIADAQKAASEKSSDGSDKSFTGTFTSGSLGFEGSGYYIILKDASGSSMKFKSESKPDIDFFVTSEETGMPAENPALIGKKFTITYTEGSETDEKGDTVKINKYIKGKSE